MSDPIPIYDEDRPPRGVLRIGPLAITATPHPDLPLALVIEAGPCFGAGTHPTTRLALEALVEHVRPGMRVLDVGTGSGLLALAAARLGATAVGVDIAPEAVACAEANRRRSGVAPAVDDAAMHNTGSARFLVGDATVAPTPGYDLVVANLFTDPLLAGAAALADALGPRGQLVVTGAPLVDAARVERALGGLGLHVVERRGREGWVRLRLTAG